MINTVSRPQSETASQRGDGVIVKKRRFLMLFLFGMCTLLSAFAWIVYSPLIELLKDLFGLSDFQVQFMSYSYMLFFLPFNVPSVIALERLGLRGGVLIGICLSAVGIVLKVFIDTSFGFVLTGQILLSIAQPFMYNAPAKVTGNWFPESERSLSTMIGTQMNVAGVVLGFLVPKIFVSPYAGQGFSSADEKANYKQQVFNMQLMIAIVASITAVLCVIFFESVPKDVANDTESGS